MCVCVHVIPSHQFPTAPSQYIDAVLQPLHDFIAANTAVLGTSAHAFSAAVVAAVTEKCDSLHYPIST